MTCSSVIAWPAVQVAAKLSFPSADCTASTDGHNGTLRWLQTATDRFEQSGGSAQQLRRPFHLLLRPGDFDQTGKTFTEALLVAQSLPNHQAFRVQAV